MLVWGMMAGMLGGFLGIGDGILVMLVLRCIVGLEPAYAAGTCVVAVFLGSQVGSRLMTEKLKSQSVKLIFGWTLLGVALLLIVKHVL